MSVKFSDQQLHEMYFEKQMTYAQIAEELECTPAAICYRMKKAGYLARKVGDYPPSEKSLKYRKKLSLQMKNRTVSDEERERIRELGKANRGKRSRTDYEFGGHEKLRADGYIKVYVPDHPYATADGYVAKHRLVMERYIGRYLEPNEVVHHKNHIRTDNRIENLQLMTASEHMSMHMRENNPRKRKEKI